jgi:hypothetical protein
MQVATVALPNVCFGIRNKNRRPVAGSIPASFLACIHFSTECSKCDRVIDRSISLFNHSFLLRCLCIFKTRFAERGCDDGRLEIHRFCSCLGVGGLCCCCCCCYCCCYCHSYCRCCCLCWSGSQTATSSGIRIFGRPSSSHNRCPMDRRTSRRCRGQRISGTSGASVLDGVDIVAVAVAASVGVCYASRARATWRFVARWM